MKHICELANELLAPNYAVGVYIAKLLHEETKTIHKLDRKVFEYNSSLNMPIIFVPHQVEDLPNELYQLKTNENSQCETIIANNYGQIMEMIKELGSKNISVEPNSFNKMLAVLKAYGFSCGYINETSFKNSREGIIWSLIFKLLKQPYSFDLFSQILALKGQAYYSPFPYVQYSTIAKNELVKEIELLMKFAMKDSKYFVQVFQLISGECPIWHPSIHHVANQEFLEQAVVISQEEGEYNLIDQCLAPYFPNVVHIGNNPNAGTKFHILHDFECVQGNVWPQQQIEAQINTASEQKLALSGDFAKLKASNLGVLDEEISLNWQIKSYVIEELSAKLKKIEITSEWKTWLMRSGVEYIKLLSKAENLADNFLKFFETISQELVEYDFNFNLSLPVINLTADFYAVDKQQKVTIAQFFFNAPTQDQIYKQNVKLALFSKMKNIANIYLIFPDKYIALDLSKPFYGGNYFEISMDNIKITNNWVQNSGVESPKVNVHDKHSKFDDLFYWNS